MEISACESFCHPQLLAVWVTGEIEPRFVVEACAFDHERIAVPVSDRVAHPRRIRVFGKRAAVHEYLSIENAGLVQHDDYASCLNNLHHRHHGSHGRTRRQAQRDWIFPAKVFNTLLRERGCPGPNFARRQVGRGVVLIATGVRLP